MSGNIDLDDILNMKEYMMARYQTKSVRLCGNIRSMSEIVPCDYNYLMTYNTKGYIATYKGVDMIIDNSIIHDRIFMTTVKYNILNEPRLYYGLLNPF